MPGLKRASDTGHKALMPGVNRSLARRASELSGTPSWLLLLAGRRGGGSLDAQVRNSSFISHTCSFDYLSLALAETKARENELRLACGMGASVCSVQW